MKTKDVEWDTRKETEVKVEHQTAIRYINILRLATNALVSDIGHCDFGQTLVSVTEKRLVSKRPPSLP